VELDANISPLGQLPLSSLSSPNKHILDHLDPEGWESDERLLLPVKKIGQSSKSTENEDQHKQKNGEHGIRDSTLYSTLTLRSNGKQPIVTTLEKNFHSNDLGDDSSRQANKNSLLDSLVHVCHSEYLKETPGMKMQTGIEGTSRQSSAIEHEALQLIMRLKDGMPKVTNSKKKTIKNFTTYVNRKLAYEGGVNNEIKSRMYENSLNIADEILFHGNLNNYSRDIVKYLHLEELESMSNNIREFVSPEVYMRRITKSVLTYTLILIGFMNSHQGIGMPENVIDQILKCILSFYQEIKNGQHINESDSVLWKSLEDLLKGKKTDLPKFCSAANRSGFVWNIVSCLMDKKKIELIPGYRCYHGVGYLMREAINKIVLILKNNKKKLAELYKEI
jgi:hypothetical protein